LNIDMLNKIKSVNEIYIKVLIYQLRIRLCEKNSQQVSNVTATCYDHTCESALVHLH